MQNRALGDACDVSCRRARLQLSNAERATLGEIGHRLGRKVLGEVANVAQPDAILAWYRRLVARKFDGSKARRSPGRPRIKGEVAHLIVRIAKENGDWGYGPGLQDLRSDGRQCPATPRSAPEPECLCGALVGERGVLVPKVILFGERSLRRVLREYVEHFHAERNHQGKGNVLRFPRDTNIRREGPVQCRERLGGLLRYYHQEAA
jgi:hypothetical protein